MDNTNPPVKKRGCLFYGCISLAVLCVIGAVLAYLGVRYGLKKANEAIAQYTDTQPATIERVELGPTELTNLQQRVATFKTGLDQQKTSEELVLTAHDINALISQDPTFKDLAGRVHVMIEDSDVRGRISIPFTNDVGPFKLKGRYLNGLAKFNVSLENGQLQVHLRDVEVNGKQIPSPILSELTKENLAKNAQNDPDTAAAIAKFQSIKVENGKIILRSKGREEPASPEPAKP